MIVHSSKYTLTLPRTNQLEQFKLWLDDTLLSRDFLVEEGDAEEFFMTPGAYLRISNLVKPVEGSDTPSPSGGTIIGTLCGVRVRSPLFVRSELRDLEGLADMQLEYRIIRSE
tara:strand:- start:104842 stop:105180 length:339 start_codon:yes stop_codon:yes gene_type:complete